MKGEWEMPVDNLYERLQLELEKFKKFLDDNVPTIKPAVIAIASVVPQINELIDKLINLMEALGREIQEMDLGAVGGHLATVTDFTNSIKTVAEVARDILPDGADDVLSVVNVVGSLPSLDDVKAAVLGLIGDATTDGSIIFHLNSLKA
jgi:hypothetical protein